MGISYMRSVFALTAVLISSVVWAKSPTTVPGTLIKPLGPQPSNRVLEGHTGSVLCLSFTADGKTLASGARDNKVIIWDVATGKQLHVLSQAQDNVYDVAYSP